MPALEWIGKKAVVNDHREVPFQLLQRDAVLSGGETDSENTTVREGQGCL